MSFLTHNPLPAKAKNELAYLSLLKTVRPDAIRTLDDHDASSLRGWLQQRQQQFADLERQFVRCYEFAFRAFFVVSLTLIGTLVTIMILGRPHGGVAGEFIFIGIGFSCCLIAAIISFMWCLALVRKLVRGRALPFKNQADRLGPLNESRDGCSELLELVRSYPEILAYRNDVIGVGRQLLLIDLEMAYELRDELEEAQAKAIQLEACRQLHAV
ncbi:hypothetical protein LMG26857_03593 [Achromobacter anxifer]|uniref:hypothetical protein n=1 Tax=Achromobacter anxifer TaxID=1287737 RepID=UPI00155CB5E0|nr:hypothetical protein [Achromobacter anxifer]CAB5514534.1 hypothetical protein LMG26857_03593 [Achromobacter anxifer]